MKAFTFVVLTACTAALTSCDRNPQNTGPYFADRDTIGTGSFTSGGAQLIPEPLPETDPAIDALYTAAKLALPSDEHATEIQYEALESYFKNATRLWLQGKTSDTRCWDCGGQSIDFSGIIINDINTSSSSSTSTSSSTTTSSSTGGSLEGLNPSAAIAALNNDAFSSTTVHVTGVDESDIAKYDGSHWFLAVQNTGYYPAPVNEGFHIVSTNADTHQAQTVSSYGNAPIDGLYLVGNDEGTTDVTTLRYSLSDKLTSIEIVDVQEPTQPTHSWRASVEGELITSRKVDNVLYLVTQHSFINNLPSDLQQESRYNAQQNARMENRTNNEAILAHLQWSYFMPTIRVGEAALPLTQSCHFRADEEGSLSYSEMTHLTAIDLEHKTIRSTCVGGRAEVASFTKNSAFVTSSYFKDSLPYTYIHKFELQGNDNTPSYSATGEVLGELSDISDQAFKIHATDSDVRLVTSVDFEHHLFILEEQDGKLIEVATLPNEQRPEPLGLPNEPIFSVRFEDDIAYIVTFGRTLDHIRNQFNWDDPIYRIDLSDRTDPKITGDLELPGYASYMLPVANGHLFTIGNDVDESTGCIEGLKLELFDVSGDTPTIVNTHILGNGGTSSIALEDIGAITLLQVNENTLRIALPTDYKTNFGCRRPPGFPGTFNLSSTSSGGSTWSKGLHMFEVDSSGAPTLVDLGMLVAEDETLNKAPSKGTSRSVLHNDAVFFTRSNAVWTSAWGGDSWLSGPITANQCSEESIPGLEITVVSEEPSAQTDLCQTIITATSKNGDSTEILTAMPSSNNTESCIFSGALEKTGEFNIDYALPGNRIYGYSDIVISGDHCHVNTQTMTAVAEPIASCIARNPQPITFVPTPPFDSDDNVDTCSIVATILDEYGNTTTLPAIPKSEITDAEPLLRSMLQRDDVECVFQVPLTIAGNFTFTSELTGFPSYDLQIEYNNKGVCQGLETARVYSVENPLPD